MTVIEKIEKIAQLSEYNTEMIVAIEELAELQKAICKVLRNPEDEAWVENLHEEIVDVLVVVKILIYYFNINLSEIHVGTHRKLDRTLEQLKFRRLNLEGRNG